MNRLALPARLVPSKRAYVFLATAALATLVALTIAVSKASAAVVFNGSPGTAAPPATLGPYTMKPFANDPRPEFSIVSDVPSPTGGVVGFSPDLTLLTVGSGWGTWSHGYTGDVYWTTGGTSVTMTMPAGTKAFYFYAEPNPFGSFDITATTNSGVTSGPIPVVGFAGATYFGFYTTGIFETFATITVDSTVDFAIGEFGIKALGCAPAPSMASCRPLGGP